MKNLLLLIMAASLISFVACNNESSNSEETSATEEETTEKDLSTDLIDNNNTASETEAAKGPTTEITFDSYDHDFGQVEAGDVVEHTFMFTNTGENELIISDAKGSCGCTVPYYPKEPIAPGETGEIKIKYDSKGKNGMQRKNVTITANTDPGKTVLNIQTEVLGDPNAQQQSIQVQPGS
ncbi:MAG: DUF1573 domain-containing protein [Chitinophagales bacterium]